MLHFDMNITIFYDKMLLYSSNVNSSKRFLLISHILKGGDIFYSLQQIDELLEYYYSHEPKWFITNK